MKTSDFLKITPEELAKRQHDELNAFVVKRLRDVARLIEDGEYCTIDSPLHDIIGFSSSCDYTGSANHFISFDDAFGGARPDGCSHDIQDCLDRLETLARIIDGNRGGAKDE